MQSQSPGIVVFRALVMLSCLVAIPLAAVFGTALPDLFDKFLDGKLLDGRLASVLAFSEDQPNATSQIEPEIPGLTSTNLMPPSVTLGEQTPQGGPRQTASGQRGPAVEPVGAWGRPTTHSPSTPAVVQATYEIPIGTAPPQPIDHGAPRRLQPSLSAGASMIQPVAGGSPVSPNAHSTSGTAAVNPPHVDRFTHIQNRLQELGATYYMLETLGTMQSQYRFHCRMAVGGNPTFVKRFEATDSDPLTAMAKVLGEAERWRAGRLR